MSTAHFGAKRLRNEALSIPFRLKSPPRPPLLHVIGAYQRMAATCKGRRHPISMHQTHSTTTLKVVCSTWLRCKVVTFMV